MSFSDPKSEQNYANYKLYESEGTFVMESVFSSGVQIKGVDQYGNMLTNAALLSADGTTKMLSSFDFDGARAEWNFYNGTISVAITKESGEKAEWTYYSLGEEGNLVSSFSNPYTFKISFLTHDLFEMEDINRYDENGNTVGAWQDYLSYEGSTFGPVSFDNPRSWYYPVVIWINENYANIPNAQELINSKFSSITKE